MQLPEQSTPHASRVGLVLAILAAMLTVGCGDDEGTRPPKTVTLRLFPESDVFVYSEDPDQNYDGGAPNCPNCGGALILSPAGGHMGESRVLLSYSLSEIPPDSKILSATLSLKDLEGKLNNTDDCVSFSVQEITTVWSESSATWNNQPRYFDVDRGNGIICEQTFDYTVDLDTRFLQEVVDGERPNRGLALLPIGEGEYGANTKVFESHENDGKGLTLTVSYED